ncbi:di-trans-poly-cis-decaprenylcistransferase [Apiospora saccharicola]|uniref:Alkyl transferase n=1 Tax=Apiospora saccharicola TaxID=335842 RepID=A0ABR1W2Q2_9PEZI
MSIKADANVQRWIATLPPISWALRQAREMLIGTLRQGPIPQHVAFEMDGNRRFAKNNHIETIEGHNMGFEALAKVLEVCYKCGVKVVTVYAFSIENFNRPKSEVSGLMKMAKLKLEQLCQHGELLDRYGAGIRVLGERDMIPDDVLPFVDRAIEMTKHNTDAVLNICFPYTSRAEMTAAIKATVDEFSMPAEPAATPFSQARITETIRSKQPKRAEPSLPTLREDSPDPAAKSDVDDSVSSTTTLNPGSPQTEAKGKGKAMPFKDAESITVDSINSHMYTADCPPLDIFIRTSNVMRLSDFMLWQCHEDTHIFFLKCFWPEMDLWHFIPVLLEWQWRQKKEREGRSGRRLKTE